MSNHFGVALAAITVTVIGGAFMANRIWSSPDKPATEASATAVKPEIATADATTNGSSATVLADAGKETPTAPAESRPQAAPVKATEPLKKVTRSASVAPAPAQIKTAAAPARTAPAPAATIPLPIDSTPAPAMTTPAPIATAPAPIETAPTPSTAAPAQETASAASTSPSIARSESAASTNQPSSPASTAQAQEVKP